MILIFKQLLDKVGVYFIFLCIPGILLLINGIHVLKTKNSISVGRDSSFRWKKPTILKGKNAIRDGKIGIIYGLILIIIGLLSVIGAIQ